ncbi:MAG: hypothetical protein ACRYFX_00515 [Janthinobacterium lividum]
MVLLKRDLGFSTRLDAPGLPDWAKMMTALGTGQPAPLAYTLDDMTSLVIRYGFHATPFGERLLSLTDRGICGLTFQPATERPVALAQLHAAWPGATHYPDEAETAAVTAQLFGPAAARGSKPIPLLLQQAYTLVAEGHQLSDKGVGSLVADSGRGLRFVPEPRGSYWAARG